MAMFAEAGHVGGGKRAGKVVGQKKKNLSTFTGGGGEGGGDRILRKRSSGDAGLGEDGREGQKDEGEEEGEGGEGLHDDQEDEDEGDEDDHGREMRMMFSEEQQLHHHQPNKSQLHQTRFPSGISHRPKVTQSQAALETIVASSSAEATERINPQGLRKPKRGRRSKAFVQDPQLEKPEPKVLKKGNRAGVFICQVTGCGQFFSRKEHLERHLLMHTGEKPFRCILCPKGFSREDNLKQHLKVHEKKERGAGGSHITNMGNLGPDAGMEDLGQIISQHME